MLVSVYVQYVFINIGKSLGTLLEIEEMSVNGMHAFITGNLREYFLMEKDI